MKKLFLTLCLLLGLVCAGNAQTLKFNANGKFKIVQFTDVHYIYNDPRSDIFTGDVIYGKPAEEGMRTVLNLVSKREIPFAVTFGNHDNEQGLTREELFKIIQSIPHNLTTTTEGISGVTNFILPLKSSDGSKDE